ncbi:MAG: hypothetical protein M1825_000815 [Sarcosagium campestre]|nr:MAG: hypothetical protein M1825_000815 [Sarcosagium campestre]
MARRTRTTARPSLMSRLRGGNRRRAHPTTTTTHHTTTTTTHPHGTAGYGHHAAPVHHQRRRPSFGDKVSGAMMRLKGTLTHRPGVKPEHAVCEAQTVADHTTFIERGKDAYDEAYESLRRRDWI